MKKEQKSTILVKNDEKVNENGIELIENDEKQVKIDKINKTRKLSKKQIYLVDETIKALLATPTKRECAKMIGISDVALSKRFKVYPEIMRGLEQMKSYALDRVRDRIAVSTPKFADNTMDLANNANSESVKLQANLELLAIAGISKPAPENKVQVNVFNAVKKDKEDFEL